jgi:selenocysteine lyase/cysteine desulfurase
MNLRRIGVRVRAVRNRDGRYPIGSFEKAIGPRTRLVSVSSVEFVNGFRMDLAALGDLCRERNVLFCVDAIQSLGLIPMDVKKFRIDFLSADGHKWLVGPEGLGLFFCKKDRIPKLNLVSVGWHTVVNDHDFSTIDFRLKRSAGRFEEGSHNTLSILALGASIEYLLGIGIRRIEKRVLELTDRLLDGLERMGYSILSSRETRERSGSLLFSAGSPAENRRLYARLTKHRILVSLRGPGIRVSPHFYNTEGEVETFLRVAKRR